MSIDEITAVLGLGLTGVSIVIGGILGAVGWIQGRTSVTKAAIESINEALEVETRWRKELLERVEVLEKCPEQREELQRENDLLKGQIESMKRQISRLTKELEHLKRQLFGDGTDSTPVE